jgi:3-phosphoshikimate 1-carboxyvinyltransferase
VLRDGLAVLVQRGGEDAIVNCDDSGAGFRILAALAATTPGARVRLVGTRRLGERPHGPLFASLRNALGPAGLFLDEGDPWPLAVRGAGRADAPRFVVDARQSSQFATSLLLAAAALSVRERRRWAVVVQGAIASPGYVDLTVSWLARCGFDVLMSSQSIEVAFGSPPMTAPTIPGDWSSLAYLLLVAWRTGGSVGGVDRNAAHPDREVLRVLQGIGLSIVADEGGGVRVSGTPTGGASVSGKLCPDLLPTVAALACVLPAPSRLSHVSILRNKESDRVTAIEALVTAAGGRTFMQSDDLVIVPGRVPRHFAIDSQGDHRMAMSAATLAVLARAEVVLNDPACVDKSFPMFWRELTKAGVSTTPALR